jgi:hypothetical protein
MRVVAFDTLKSAEKLTNVGFSPNQAKAIVETEKEAVQEILNSGLATKEDILNLKEDILILKEAMKEEFQNFKEAMKKEFQHFREETRKDTQNFKDEMRKDAQTFKDETNKRFVPMEKKLFIHNWMLRFILFFQTGMFFKLFF